MRWDRREWGERVHRREERWMCHQDLCRPLEWRQRRRRGHSRGSGAKLGDKTGELELEGRREREDWLPDFLAILASRESLQKWAVETKGWGHGGRL